LPLVPNPSASARSFVAHGARTRSVYPIFIGTADFPFSRECAAREVLLRSTNELDRWERRYVEGLERLGPGFISRFIRNSPSFNRTVTLRKYKGAYSNQEQSRFCRARSREHWMNKGKNGGVDRADKVRVRFNQQ
jgi:hypothetical protein